MVGQAVLYILSLFGVGFFVSIVQAKPHIQLEHLDSKDPVRFPFRVVNDDSVLTFYQVTPTTEVATREPSKLAPTWAAKIPGNLFLEPGTFLIDDTHAPVDIRPGDGHSFIFNTRFTSPIEIPDDLTLKIGVAYEVRFVPFIYSSFLTWHRHSDFSFRVQKDSNGTPYWIQY
ncbi:MAG: hypothetical protein WAU82_10930 [Candidatus Binatus sp.]